MEAATVETPGLTRVSFQRERASPDLFLEIAPLLVAHFTEIAHFSDIELNPDYSLYLAMEDGGGLRVYTARRSDGELIGYAIFFVRRNPHYRTSLQAVQDILFVRPDQRGVTGARLIMYADAELKREGVQAVMHHVKAAHNFGPLLERLGYQLVDLIYAKRLDH